MSNIDAITTAPSTTMDRSFRTPMAIKNGRLILALFIGVTLFNLFAALGFVGGVNWGYTTGFDGAPGINWETFWNSALPLILAVIALVVVVVATFLHHRLVTSNRNTAATVMFAVAIVLAFILGGIALSLMITSDTVGLVLVALSIFVVFTLLEIASIFGLAHLLRVK